jgi:cyclopropane fatty-acyl-phospholipid synthase-like methyltransferase
MVTACDFDASAITSAQKNWRRPNLKFVVADIRTQMPSGKYDNIVWDAAIEHFTESEIAKLMKDVKERMKSDAVLSGYTIVERDDGVKHIHQHEYEFQSKEDLMRFLEPHFAHVVVFETVYPSRHNLYFWASDDHSQIPFNHHWQAMCISAK